MLINTLKYIIIYSNLTGLPTIFDFLSSKIKSIEDYSREFYLRLFFVKALL